MNYQNLVAVLSASTLIYCLVYKKLVSEKSKSPNQSQQKWQEDIILNTKQELN